jgi:hypothetical protein
MVELDKKLGENLSDEGAELNIYGPDGSELGIKLKVLSFSSKTVQNTVRTKTKKTQQKIARGATVSLDEQRTNEAEILKALIVGGTPFKVNGEEFNPAKLTLKQAKVLIEDYPFIVEQVNDFAENDANFYSKLVGN